MIDNEIELCQQIALKYDVTPDIHHEDFIFNFLTENIYPKKSDAILQYFNDGSNSAEIFKKIIYTDIGFKEDNKLSLLEFASGYGCVTRHLVKKLSNVEITACDIHPEAMEFIQKRMKTNTVLSHSIPEEASFPRNYDIIFALSFFSHMPHSTWGRWLRKLYTSLNTNGYLIFTTHGLGSLQFFGNPKMPNNGFWFSPIGEQKDINVNEYGSTVVTPEFVIREIFQQTQAPLFLYKPSFWWQHQDLYILFKPSISE
jgi:cyclopropane fatty-acyl-phospholipid synthase-like methyltransferase